MHMLVHNIVQYFFFLCFINLWWGEFFLVLLMRVYLVDKSRALLLCFLRFFFKVICLFLMYRLSGMNE